MLISVDQKELICNLRYVKCCDYYYSYNEWLDHGKECKTVINHSLLEQINNDTRECIFIYCRTDHIVTIFKMCESINKRFVLVSGSSDIPINDSLYKQKPNNIVKWFAININCRYKDLISLPMGTLSGTWIGNNKYDSEIYNHINYKPVITDGKESINTNLVFMCFTIGTNNSERSKVYNYFNDKNWVTNLCQHKTGKYLEHSEFMNNVFNHKFTICPLGNGIDCGRTWTALQLGSIPILKNHICFQDWPQHIPIILYDDLSEITEDFLLKKIEEFKTKKYDYNYLKTSYWKSRFEIERQ